MRTLHALVVLLLIAGASCDFVDEMTNIKVKMQGDERCKIKFEAFERKWVLRLNKNWTNVGDRIRYELHGPALKRVDANYYYTGSVKGDDDSTVSITVPNMEDDLFRDGTVFTDGRYLFIDSAATYYKDEERTGYVIWQVASSPVSRIVPPLHPVNPSYMSWPTMQIYADEEFKERWGYTAGTEIIQLLLSQANEVFARNGISTVSYDIDDIHWLLGVLNPAPGTTSESLLFRRFRFIRGVSVYKGGADFGILFTGKNIEGHGSSFQGTSCLLCTADYLGVSNWEDYASTGIAMVRVNGQDGPPLMPVPEGVQQEQDGSVVDVGSASSSDFVDEWGLFGCQVKNTVQKMGNLLGASVLSEGATTNAMSSSYSSSLKPGDLQFSCTSEGQMLKTCMFEVSGGEIEWLSRYSCTS